jgi:hypothetical protein
MIATIARADTPPLGTVNAKLQDGAGNPLTSTVIGGNRSLNVDVLNSISATVSSSPASPLSDQLIVGGSVIDPRDRNWTLGVGTDSVTAYQGGAWSLGRTWNLSSSSDSVNVGNFPATQVVTGTVTANAGTGTFTVGQSTGTNLHTVVDSGAVSATQSGSWTTGRTWNLSNLTDSVSVSNFPSSLSVTQGTSPWLTSRNWNLSSGSDSVAVSGTVTANAGSGNFTVVQSTGSNLHVNVDSAPTTSVTQGTSPWVTSISTGVQDNTPANQNITTQDTSSTSTTVANGQIYISGTPTANSAATFNLASQETIRVIVTGTWTGTLVSEASPDGSNWTVQGIHQSGTSYTVSTFTANFTGAANVVGFQKFRIRSTAAMTGTAVVQVTSSVNPNSIYLANAAKLADATTPTNQLAIKASSTAAATTDTAAVVALSPNTAMPANTNGATSNATVGTSASTITAPANATGFILESESTNTANCRWALGTTASSSVGMLIEPGRDTGYIPGGASISVYCSSAAQLIDVQWVLRQ